MENEPFKISSLDNQLIMYAHVIDDIAYVKCICNFTNVIKSNFEFNNFLFSMNEFYCSKCKSNFRIVKNVISPISEERIQEIKIKKEFPHETKSGIKFRLTGK